MLANRFALRRPSASLAPSLPPSLLLPISLSLAQSGGCGGDGDDQLSVASLNDRDHRVGRAAAVFIGKMGKGRGVLYLDKT